LRIIAGDARGRRFEAPTGIDTRPTLDRVKEAIFGAVQFDVPDAIVLDLFSGSGNLGLEALSRGARLAVLNDSSTSELIANNVKALGFENRARVLDFDYRKAIAYCAECGLSFDLAFIDAPYASGFGFDAVDRLFSSDVVAEHGIVILEHSSSDSFTGRQGCFAVYKTKRYGQCSVTMFKGEY
jgi:16S rRNA (guanine966-N2)-methyltransferase